MFKIFETQKFLGLKISDNFETSLKNFPKFFRPKNFVFGSRHKPKPKTNETLTKSSRSGIIYIKIKKIPG